MDKNKLKGSDLRHLGMLVISYYTVSYCHSWRHSVQNMDEDVFKVKIYFSLQKTQKGRFR